LVATRRKFADSAIARHKTLLTNDRRLGSMSNLFAARSQMAVSLAFHIVFAEVGIAMPLMMTVAEWRWLRTGDGAYL